MNHDITHCNGDIKDEHGTISCIKKNSCQRYLAHLDLMQHRVGPPVSGWQSYTDAATVLKTDTNYT